MKSKRSSLHGSLHGTMAEKYSLGPSPEEWGISLYSREADDDLHDPRAQLEPSKILTMRALVNIGCLMLLLIGCFALFVAYPVVSHYLRQSQSFQGGFNLGGINASGQVPEISSNGGLIDKDTPREAYTRPSYQDPTQDMVLVFSDEFNTDGRTFYPGDDPYWEAVDLHYWGTVDLEWYDPMQATTSDGYLRLRIDKVDDIADNHNLQYRSGMIQSWNKFCFTGGIIEAGIILPGSNNVSGLWPALWTMGNLGRAGFGGSLDGVWPYTYDSCDVGTLANQTYPPSLSSSPDITTPAAAIIGGDPNYNGQLSLLPGQKLSACTCPGEAHPGPIRPDGTFVGRSSPEIDVLEAIVNNGVGQASLSAQWAPFDAGYIVSNSTDNIIIQNVDTIKNTFIGGAFQQTTSGLATTSQECYELGSQCSSVYGFEYKPGFDDGYITWVSSGQLSWTLKGPAMGANTESEISQRPISSEPMYIIANLGLSLGFGTVDFDNLIFPATMSIDYIRVYQPADSLNVGCDPKDFPTAKYIETFQRAYTNANLTDWADVQEPWPKNRLIDTC
ncbi:Beta-glucan synthesis-associated protein KRE6 [Psilocybe cubensis]|nr:Beta-glucan synthesis-associated protein KRE6 [Psilocybe cubensis]KAH9476791.1 Beta-glucan synthesis-associated protein KRE6 [Psilocybe cubensis]